MAATDTTRHPSTGARKVVSRHEWDRVELADLTQVVLGAPDDYGHATWSRVMHP